VTAAAALDHTKKQRKYVPITSFFKEAGQIRRNLRILPIGIEHIHKGCYVLASTAPMFPNDPRYQRDCWSKVDQVMQGAIVHEEDTTLVSYNENETESVTLESRIGHHFYALLPGNIRWQWVRASKLQEGAVLFQGFQGEPCAVTEVSPNPHHFGGWLFRELKGRPQVFNLATNSYTYYVGPWGSQVLVHTHR